MTDRNVELQEHVIATLGQEISHLTINKQLLRESFCDIWNTREPCKTCQSTSTVETDDIYRDSKNTEAASVGK